VFVATDATADTTPPTPPARVLGKVQLSPDSTKNTMILPPGFRGLGYYSSPDLLKTYSTTLSKPSNNSLVRLEEETPEAPWWHQCNLPALIRHK